MPAGDAVRLARRALRRYLAADPLRYGAGLPRQRALSARPAHGRRAPGALRQPATGGEAARLCAPADRFAAAGLRHVPGHPRQCRAAESLPRRRTPRGGTAGRPPGSPATGPLSAAAAAGAAAAALAAAARRPAAAGRHARTLAFGKFRQTGRLAGARRADSLGRLVGRQARRRDGRTTRCGLKPCGSCRRWRWSSCSRPGRARALHRHRP